MVGQTKGIGDLQDLQARDFSGQGSRIQSSSKACERRKTCSSVF